MALYHLQHGTRNRKINENMQDFSVPESVTAYDLQGTYFQIEYSEILQHIKHTSSEISV
jgi:hypothetical protein